MYLCSLPKGKYAKIEKINSPQLALQLAQMGLVIHVPIKIIQRNSKTIIVESYSTRIILGSGMAKIIEVET